MQIRAGTRRRTGRWRRWCANWLRKVVAGASARTLELSEVHSAWEDSCAILTFVSRPATSRLHVVRLHKRTDAVSLHHQTVPSLRILMSKVLILQHLRSRPFERATYLGMLTLRTSAKLSLHLTGAGTRHKLFDAGLANRLQILSFSSPSLSICTDSARFEPSGRSRRICGVARCRQGSRRAGY